MTHISSVKLWEPDAYISEIEARFPQDQGSGGDIPILAATAGDSAIELAGRDLNQTIGQRRIGRTAGIFETCRLHFLVDGPRSGDQRGCAGAAVALERLAIEPGTTILGGAIKLIAGRRVDDAGDRFAILDDSQTDGPAILATQKSACTINGINDKDALAIEATGIVGSLLAEPAIGRAGAQQAGCEVTVDDNIGFADGGGILLGPAFDVP